jgi:hypothetical protein
MLHYNENKVAAGEAMLLLASGFAGDSTPVKSVKFNLLKNPNLLAKSI